MRTAVFLLPAMFLMILLMPISGYRHLWQDELETAERAKSIVYGGAGVPLTIDPYGQVSLNAGGREIEEGAVHRYTPWGQFYFGAVGIVTGSVLDTSPDASVRSPFILAHALTSSLIGYGLYALAGLPMIPSLFVSSIFGLQSVRLINNRTCRYHALLDLLFAIGMIGIGLRNRKDSKLAKALVGCAVFLLPQCHTLGGSLLASLLVLASIASSIYLQFEKGPSRSFWLSLKTALAQSFWSALVPIVLSIFLVLILTRPWLQTAWNSMPGPNTFRSIKSGFEIAYAFYIFAAAIVFFLFQKERRFSILLGTLILYVFVAGRILDLHPFSQARYYLSLPIFFLFWPIALPWPKKVFLRSSTLVGIATIGILLPEIQGVMPPLQGIRVVLNDWRLQAEGESQPLREALQTIREAGSKDAVLIDYVPQFANWYLPAQPIALMPDSAMKTQLNRNNPVWDIQLLEPEWHLAFFTAGNGLWTCSPKCDFTSRGFGPSADRYELFSGRLDRSFSMCIVKRWKTYRWNNAPFAAYSAASLFAAGTSGDEGTAFDELTLARRCR